MFTQLGRGGVEQRLDLVMAAVRALTAPRRAVSSGLERLGVWVLGYGQVVTGQRGPGRSVGIQWIRLALTAPGGAVGAADLDDLNLAVLQRSGETGTVAGVPSTPATNTSPSRAQPMAT